MDIFSLLFSPSGRIGRSQYWMGYILQFVIVLALIYGILGAAKDHETKLVLPFLAAMLLPVWVGFCVIVKRLHDRDKSGFLYLLIFVPGANFWLVFIECGCLAGSQGTNSYGPPGGAGSSGTGVAGSKYTYADEPDKTADIDAMIARAKTTILAPPPRPAMQAGGQMAMARPAGPPVFGKRR